MSRNLIFKKTIAIILIMLFSVNSFAAVVSDNDGSAFITKAEFDSLKNNFQAQIDQYNTSIDNKIDGAIAAYLSGIRVSTKETVKTYIEKYKDLYWCHDFSIEAKVKKWTSRTAKTISNSATVQPDLTNQNGWMPWRKDRGTRFDVILPTNFGTAVFAARTAFSSDGTYTKTTTNVADGAMNYTVPIISLKVTGDAVIDENPLLNFYEAGYKLYRYGLDHQSNFSMTMTNSSRDVTVTPQVAASDDEYFTLYLYCSYGSVSHTQVWNNKNTYAFNVYARQYSESEPTTSATSLEGTKFTFPLNSYFAKSANMATEDQKRIYNMMIGASTDFRIPFIYDYRLGGPNGAISTGAEESTKLYFCDWSHWVKRSINTTLTVSPFVGVTQDNSGKVYTQNLSITNANLTLNMPVVTRSYVSTLKSPVAIYNNQNLSICGGIPILMETQKTGKLTVKLKCEKSYDDIDKGSVGNTNAHIKFKKTDCTDSLSNYLSGTYDSGKKSATFDGSQTIDISDETFILDVNKGENVWLNIDPITLGQHIKITNLECTLEYE